MARPPPTDLLALHLDVPIPDHALQQAGELAQATGADVTFVESELYRAPDVLPTGAFDLVYAGMGALCWLPDVRRWAAVVAALLRPGGRLFLREGHPVLWSLDEKRDDALVIGFPYFEHEVLAVELALKVLAGPAPLVGEVFLHPVRSHGLQDSAQPAIGIRSLHHPSNHLRGSAVPRQRSREADLPNRSRPPCSVSPPAT